MVRFFDVFGTMNMAYVDILNLIGALPIYIKERQVPMFLARMVLQSSQCEIVLVMQSKVPSYFIRSIWSYSILIFSLCKIPK